MSRILILIALGAAAVYYIYEIRKEAPSEVESQLQKPSFAELIEGGLKPDQNELFVSYGLPQMGSRGTVTAEEMEKYRELMAMTPQQRWLTLKFPYIQPA